MRTRLSVAMLVRDEWGKVEALLPKLRCFADEVVLVDTLLHRYGDITRPDGCKVVDFEWCDDFSRARNYALAHCTGDYVFMTDPDTSISQRTVDYLSTDAFKSSLDTKRATVYFGLRHMRHANGRMTSHNGIRLFPNRDNIRFKYRVHEDVSEDVERLGLQKVMTEVEETHQIEGGQAYVVKLGYYKDLLMLDIAEHGETPRLCSFMAATCYGLQQFGECIAWGHKVMKACEGWELSRHAKDPWLRLCTSQVFDSFISLSRVPQNIEMAHGWIDAVAKLYPWDGMVHYLKGLSNMITNRPEKAVEAFRRAAHLKCATECLPLPSTINEDLIAHLGRCLRESGQASLANEAGRAFLAIAVGDNHGEDKDKEAGRVSSI